MTPDNGAAESFSITYPKYRQCDGDNFIINNTSTFKVWDVARHDWEAQSRVANDFKGVLTWRPAAADGGEVIVMATGARGDKSTTFTLEVREAIS